MRIRTTDYTDFLDGIFHHLQFRRNYKWNLFHSVKSV